MSISGDASGTGKSLMQSCCMLMFHGEPQTTVTSISDSSFYELLSDGSIYGNERYRQLLMNVAKTALVSALFEMVH